VTLPMGTHMNVSSRRAPAVLPTSSVTPSGAGRRFLASCSSYIIVTPDGDEMKPSTCIHNALRLAPGFATAKKDRFSFLLLVLTLASFKTLFRGSGHGKLQRDAFLSWIGLQQHKTVITSWVHVDEELHIFNLLLSIEKT